MTAIDIDLSLLSGQLPERDFWRSFRRHLMASGYADVLASTEPTEEHMDAVARVRAGLTDQLAALVDLFALGRRVPLDALPANVVDDLRRLVPLDVCRFGDGAVRLAGISLYRVLGHWLFADAPSFAPTRYVGDDSIALVNHADHVPGGRALDFCSGPGIQAIALSAKGMDVTAVEINPASARLQRLNLALNELEDKVHLVVGDLETIPLQGGYDVIVANPPLLPIPSIPYPFVGDGGPDGLVVVRHILDRVAELLNADGHAQILGLALYDDHGMLNRFELDEWCTRHSMQMLWTTVTISDLAADGAWCEGIGGSSVHYVDGDASDIPATSRLIADRYKEMGASGIGSYYLRVTRDAASPGFRHLDLTGSSGVRPIPQWYVR